VEQLTFLGGYESGDCVPLSVHSVSVVSLMTGGDPEVGDVLRHMAATTNGAQAIKGHLKRLNDRRGAANSTLRPSKQVGGHTFDLSMETGDSRSDNPLNLRNELDSLEIDDFLERTDHHLPYPLRRNRLSALVVAVTTGEVDTCSTSSGCP